MEAKNSDKIKNDLGISIPFAEGTQPTINIATTLDQRLRINIVSKLIFLNILKTC